MSKTDTIKDEIYYMEKALIEAKKAGAEDEVPVGAVIVHNGKIIARAYNKRITDTDATAHAEIAAIRKAGKRIGNWRLNGCIMYVTLEPCAMCAGALINSRIDKVVYGAKDSRFGCCGSIYNLPGDKSFNHRLEVSGGVMEKECGEILSSFFMAKRTKA